MLTMSISAFSSFRTYINAYQRPLPPKERNERYASSLVGSRADTEETAKEIEVDLNLCEDLREVTLRAEDLTDKTIRTTERRIDLGAHTDQTA